MQDIAAFIEDCPSDMRPVERMFLYSLIRGSRPKRVLEIGAFKGGSAMIISRALRDNGAGRAMGIDPHPQADFATLPLHGVYELIIGTSPERIPEAAERLGGRFDLVIVDGLHTYSAVRADVFGVLPYLATEAFVLLHDAFHYGVRKGITECVDSVPGLVDCGLVCNAAAVETDPLVDPWLTYCGLQLLRYRQRTVPVEEQLTALYRPYAGMEARFGSDILDHNEFACLDTPCPRCRALRDELLRQPEPRVFRAARVEGEWVVDRKVKRAATRAEVANARDIPLIPYPVFRALPER